VPRLLSWPTERLRSAWLFRVVDGAGQDGTPGTADAGGPSRTVNCRPRSVLPDLERSTSAFAKTAGNANSHVEVVFDGKGNRIVQRQMDPPLAHEGPESRGVLVAVRRHFRGAVRLAQLVPDAAAGLLGERV